MRTWFLRAPWYGRVLAVLVTSAVAVVAARTAWVAPRRDALAVERLELRQRRVAIRDARLKAARLEELEREGAVLERRLRALVRAFPRAPEAATVLREMQMLAAQSELTVVAFTPLPAGSRPPYATRRVRLELTGRFHELLAFIEAVASLPRLVTLTELSVRALDPPQPSATIRVICTAETYVLDALPGGKAEAEARADGA